MNQQFAETISIHLRSLHHSHSITDKVGKNVSKTVCDSPHFTRHEYIPNDMVLLIKDITYLESACLGKLLSLINSQHRQSYSSLLSYASPIIKGRYGVIGIVSQRSKSLDSGVIVEVSRRLFNSQSKDPLDFFLLRIGYNMAGKNHANFKMIF